MRFLTAGESHGRALMGIIEGVPSGLAVTSPQMQFEMRRRKLGYGRGFRQQIEDDLVELMTGVRHGKTIGAPVGLLVWNRDFEGDPNIVEVYIRRLRNKVDRPFGRKGISTIRGSGYRMAGDGG